MSFSIPVFKSPFSPIRIVVKAKKQVDRLHGLGRIPYSTAKKEITYEEYLILIAYYQEELEVDDMLDYKHQDFGLERALSNEKRLAYKALTLPNLGKFWIY